jgi:glutamate synthase domain-containing protein 3
MTGGRVVVLGKTGRNFGAGMCGGLAYVFDIDGNFAGRVNPARVDLERLQPDDLEVVQQMIHKHHAYTGSERAREVLRKWEDCASRFVKIHPRDLKSALAAQLETEGGDG